MCAMDMCKKGNSFGSTDNEKMVDAAIAGFVSDVETKIKDPKTITTMKNEILGETISDGLIKLNSEKNYLKKPGIITKIISEISKFKKSELIKRIKDTFVNNFGPLLKSQFDNLTGNVSSLIKVKLKIKIKMEIEKILNKTLNGNQAMVKTIMAMIPIDVLVDQIVEELLSQLKSKSSFGRTRKSKSVKIFIRAAKKCKGSKNYRECMKRTLKKMHRKKCGFGKKCKPSKALLLKAKKHKIKVTKKVKGKRVYKTDVELKKQLKKVKKISKRRKSPAQSATGFSVGTTKRGLDRNMWVVKKISNGVKRWVKKIKR